ncbi:MAG TPA: hypothetical protein DCS97_01725 [Planctomycetes bacterium]|nr:hypothetical protein [Planctomycetota bacterium]
MASLLSVGGLSTGIDTKTLVEQLINADRAPARLSEARRATAQARLASVQAMNTKLLAVKDAVDAVKLPDSFRGRSVTSSQETALTATSGSSALAGSTTVSVKHLAAAHQVASDPQTSATDSMGSAGAIYIQAAGATTATTITPTDYSLNGVATAINEANAGVTASVINDGVGFRLLLTSTATGSAKGIAMAQGDGALATLLPDLASLTEVTPARNALLMLGDPVTGLPVESASNTVDQVIPGVTLTLKAPGDNIAVTVSKDPAIARNAAQQMVDAFNGALSYLTANNRFDLNTKQSGPLFNDYEIPRQLDRIERALTGTVAGQPTGFTSLKDLGITLGSDGKLALNATTFDAKFAENSEEVADLFLAVGSAASEPLESLTRSIDGSMALKESQLKESIEAYTERITAYDARLEKRKALYQAQFAEMEKLTAQFQSQGNALTGFVNGLNKSSN